MARLSSSLCARLCSALLLLLAALAPAPAAAFVRPPEGIQNKVYLRLQMLSLSRIDGVSQNFFADFFLLMLHAAPNPPSTGLVCNVTQCDVLSAAVYADKFWDPRLEFINSQGTILALQGEPYSMTLIPPFLATDALPAGWVWIQTDQRFQGSFSTELNMNAFPFDIQHVEMEAQLTWPNHTAAIVYPEATADKIGRITKGMSENLGWDFLGSALDVYTHGYDYNAQIYSRMSYITSWKRQPQYYLAKIVAGTMLLVWMCIWNFSLQIDVSDRMMGTLQVFTGLISFLFVAGGDTPKLPYQTRLDVFMLFSFCIVGFIMFIHGVLYYFREQAFEGAAAEKLEAIEKKKRKALLQKMRKQQLKRAGGGGGGGSAAGSSMQIITPSGTGAAYLASSPSIPEGSQEVELGEFGGASPSPRGGDSAHAQTTPNPAAAAAAAAVAPPGVPSSSSPTSGGAPPSGSPRPTGSPRPSVGVDGSKDSARAGAGAGAAAAAGGAGTARGSNGGGASTERKEINSDVEIRVLPAAPSQSGATGNLLTTRLTAREAHARGVSVSNFVHEPSSPMSPSSREGTGQGKAHDLASAASAASAAAAAADDDDHSGWEVRLHDWKSFKFTEWFAALACTRKWDAICVPTLFLFYTIGCAAILGRPSSDGRDA